MKHLIYLILPIILLSCNKSEQVNPYAWDGQYWDDYYKKNNVIVIDKGNAVFQSYNPRTGDLLVEYSYGRVEGNTLVQPTITYQLIKTPDGLILRHGVNDSYYYKK